VPPPKSEPRRHIPPPQALNYSNPAVEKEIARRWRRIRIRNALSGAATVVTAILFLLFLTLWFSKVSLLRLLFRAMR